MLFRANLACLAAVALTVASSPVAHGQRDRSLIRTPFASFSHLPAGWHRYRDATDATSLSWHYRPNSYGWAPSMPRGGIAVSVYFPHPRQRQRYGPLRLVLPGRPATFLEGTRDTPEYRIYGRARAVDVNIFVDIPTASPNPRRPPCGSTGRFENPLLVDFRVLAPRVTFPHLAQARPKVDSTTG